MVLLLTTKPFQSTIHHPNNLLNGFCKDLLINWQEQTALKFVYCSTYMGLRHTKRRIRGNTKRQILTALVWPGTFSFV